MSDRAARDDSRAALRIWQLLTLSIYWLGIVSIWGGLDMIILPATIWAQLGGAANLGILLAILVWSARSRRSSSSRRSG